MKSHQLFDIVIKYLKMSIKYGIQHYEKSKFRRFN